MILNAIYHSSTYWYYFLRLFNIQSIFLFFDEANLFEKRFLMIEWSPIMLLKFITADHLICLVLRRNIFRVSIRWFWVLISFFSTNLGIFHLKLNGICEVYECLYFSSLLSITWFIKLFSINVPTFYSQKFIQPFCWPGLSTEYSVFPPIDHQMYPKWIHTKDINLQSLSICKYPTRYRNDYKTANIH